MKNPPYVGPVPFGRKDAPYFAGRDAEAAELTAVIRAHCLTIFYAPSGAGKTSLLSALVIPRLEERHCEVLPIGRVAGTQTGETAKLRGLRVDASTIEHRNPFAENLMAAINPDAGAAGADSIDELREFLLKSPPPAEDLIPRLRVVIIDQFEELFTKYPDAWPQREVLLETIANAISEQASLSVVFSMREEYVPALEPLLAKFVFRNQRRFRLPLLGHAQAAAAIREPAAMRNVEFCPDALEQQVKQLRGKSALTERGPMLSEFVEPLTLQVVCLKIWAALPDDAKEVDKETVLRYGHLEAALEAYYDQCVSDVSAALDEKPWKVRAFVQANLIDPRGQRKLFNPKALPGAAEDEAQRYIDQLDKCRILRPEVRHGETSYELSHDQFVPAILKSNAAQDDPLSALLFTARQWSAMGQPTDHLLSAEQLDAARQWAAQNDPHRLAGPELSLYIERSEQATNEKLKMRQEELEKRREELETKQRELENNQQELTQSNSQLLKSQRWARTLSACLGVLVLVVLGLLWLVRERGVAKEHAFADANQSLAAVMAKNAHPTSLLSTALALNSIQQNIDLDSPTDDARAIIRTTLTETHLGRAFWKANLRLEGTAVLSSDGAFAYLFGRDKDYLVDVQSLETTEITRSDFRNPEFLARGRYLLVRDRPLDGQQTNLIRTKAPHDVGRIFEGYGRLINCCQISADGSVILLQDETKASLRQLDSAQPSVEYRPIATTRDTELILSADGRTVLKVERRGPAVSARRTVDAYEAATDAYRGHLTDWDVNKVDPKYTVSSAGTLVAELDTAYVRGQYQGAPPENSQDNAPCPPSYGFNRLTLFAHRTAPHGKHQWTMKSIDISVIEPISEIDFVDDSTLLAVTNNCTPKASIARIKVRTLEDGKIRAFIELVGPASRPLIVPHFIPKQFPEVVQFLAGDKQAVELIQLDADGEKHLPLAGIGSDDAERLFFSARAEIAAYTPPGGAMVNFFIPNNTAGLEQTAKLPGLGCAFVSMYLKEQERAQSQMVAGGTRLCKKLGVHL